MNTITAALDLPDVTREILPILAGRYRRQRLRVPTLFVHGAAELCLRPDIR